MFDFQAKINQCKYKKSVGHRKLETPKNVHKKNKENIQNSKAI